MVKEMDQHGITVEQGMIRSNILRWGGYEYVMEEAAREVSKWTIALSGNVGKSSV